MTDLRTAAQQALAYLDGAAYAFEAASDGRAVSFAAYGKNCRDAAAALRAALAEPVQEPVAWVVYDIKHGGSKTLHWPEQHSPNGDPEQYKAVPLYSAPPQRKPRHVSYVCPQCHWSLEEATTCPPCNGNCNQGRNCPARDNK